jgi:UDP-glucose 4-epimerase
MHVLISGGSGYIGSYISKQLLEAGHQVSIIARSENEFIQNYKNQITVYFQDITFPFTFQLASQVDCFIHLGAANDIDSVDPAYAINASVLGTRYALDFCVKNNIKKCFYYSTFQVYGYVEGEMSELSELRPSNDYGITHQFAEQYFEMYQRTKGIDYIIIRPTNIYGSPLYKSTDRWSLVPSCFCKELLEKNEINLLSSGLQKRDFISVQEIALTNVHLLEHFGEFKNVIINVGSGTDYTIREIAEIVLDEFNSHSKKGNLIIHSEEPKHSNQYILNRDKIAKLGLSFGGRLAMKNEIKKIFKTLQD